MGHDSRVESRMKLEFWPKQEDQELRFGRSRCLTASQVELGHGENWS